MIVLRSVAVYLGSAALALLFARRHLHRPSRPVVAFLVFAPWLITGGAVLTGGVYAPLDIAYQAAPLAPLGPELGVGKTKTPILGDVVYQEIPWRKAVREAVKNGEIPLWNRFILSGEPLLAMAQPAVLHPSTWAGMFLPLAQAWTFEMTFTLFLGLLCAWQFCRELGLSPASSCVGAAGWAFGDYLLFHLGYPLSPAVAPFPLLLLGLSRIARERSARSVGTTAVALLLILAAGHSETLLHAVAAGGLYFLFRLFSEPREGRTRSVLLALAAGAITIGVGAVVLFPHVAALPHTFEYFFRNAWHAQADLSVPLSRALRALPQFVVPYAFGSSSHGGFTEGQHPSIGYVGSVLLPLAVLGLFSRRPVKWILIVLGSLGLFLWARLPVVTNAVSSLPLFDIALNARLVFLASFSVAILAALGTERILTGEVRRRTAALAAVGVLSMLVLAHLLLEERLLALAMPRDHLRLRFVLLVAPVALLAVGLIAGRGRAMIVTAGVVVGLLLLQRAGEASLLYPTIPNRAFYPPLSLLDGIPRNAPHRTSAVGYIFIPNISALYELEDVRGYEAMTFRRLYETFPLWCVHQPVWFNRIDDPTRPFLSFLNVRYFLIPDGASIPAGWPTLASGLGVHLVENPGALPRAFAPGELRVEDDANRRLHLMASIEDFGRRGVVEGLAGRPPGKWISNGPASVEILGYGARRLSLSVSAVRPTLIATSVTAWPGWRLKIDGERADLLPYNHAFLSFVVPAGRHRVDLGYVPPEFVLGAAVTAISLSGLVLAAFLRRRRRTAATSS